MKKEITPIRQLRDYSLRAEPLNLRLGYLDKHIFDFDIYLPTRKMNLQRPFVWTEKQKSELIYSLLIGRYIPDIYLICKWTEEDNWEVLDGKQRLGAMIGFLKDEFPITIEGESFLLSELPEDYQSLYRSLAPSFRVIYEKSTPFSDDQKIQWFRFINFAGTPQDEEHMALLD